LFGMAKNQFHLFVRHAGKPFQEIVDPGATFDILEQRSHWNAGVLK